MVCGTERKEANESPILKEELRVLLEKPLSSPLLGKKKKKKRPICSGDPPISMKDNIQ